MLHISGEPREQEWLGAIKHVILLQLFTSQTLTLEPNMRPVDDICVPFGLGCYQPDGDTLTVSHRTPV